MNFMQPIPDCYDQQVVQVYGTSELCWTERVECIAARVYIIVAIVNGVCIIATTLLFIYVATGSINPTAARSSITAVNNPRKVSTLSTKQLNQARKKNSIQKRSVMGITLGAIGHLIFSSCLLLAQALNAAIGCELILWGVCIGFYTWMFAFCIRAHRLKFMFRLNQLKVKYLRMPSSDRLLCIDDKDYRWYMSHKKNIKRTLMRPYILYAISLVIIVVIAVPVEVFTQRASGCPTQRGAGLLIGFFGFFILVLIPFIFWYLKDNADAHGIRKELWIDAIIGVPLFVVYIAFFFVFQPQALTVQDSVYRLYKPGNWVVVFTAIAHFISVVIPVITYLPIENKTWIKFINYISKKTSLKKTQSSGTGAATKSESRHNSNSNSNPIADDQPTTSVSIPEIIPELSVESLEKSMSDPDMIHQLQDLAIRDFSSENVLFYEKYLELETQFKHEFIKNDSVAARSWIQSYIITKKPSASSIVQQQQQQELEQQLEDDSPSTKGIEQQKKIQRFLSTPIPFKMYPLFIKFYETYIAENTSSQVNISYRARHQIDLAFEILYQRYPELDPKIIENSSSNRSMLTTFTSRLSTDDPLEKYMKQQEEFEPILTMGTFEEARIEVCWNIFNSVYPKFVSMYNNNNSLPC